MVETLIFLVRLVLACLAPWLLILTWRSLYDLTRGSQSLADMGRAVQALFAISVTIGQVYFLAYGEAPVLLLALICSAIGLCLAVWTSYRAQAKGLRHLDRMIDRPDLCHPMLELAEIDPGKAADLAQQARRRIAQVKAGL